MIGSKKIDRIIVVGLLGLAVWLILLGRLFITQIANADEYRSRARRQHQRKRVVKAPRGLVFDRDNVVLAKNIPALDFWTERDAIVNIDRVDSAFATVLGLEPGYIKNRIRNSRTNWLYLARGVELSKGRKLRFLEKDSVFSTECFARVYPLGRDAGQLIGFIDPDGKGLEGIEHTYDRQLSGTDGEVIVLSDQAGRDYRLFQYGSKPPIPGHDIHLTIDADLQRIVESELAESIVESCRADGGMAVFMRPSTGEILAMACYPAFSPENYAESDPEHRKMRVITDIYEPGSTFKIVTFSALLATDKFDPEETVDCEWGEWFFCDDTIHDAEPHGKITAREVLIHSSNIGTIKLAQRLPKDTLYSYARAYGFGNPTGIDLSGEVGGILHKPYKWSGMTPAAFPMGHEVAGTAIQIATAYGALANRGILVQPYLVDRITHRNGSEIYKHEPVSVRRVIEEADADTLCELMKTVVDSGTGIR
ncbi:hypothetical protein DRQ36_08410, partial [bacterium]